MRVPLPDIITPGNPGMAFGNALAGLQQQQAAAKIAQANALVAPQLAQGQANIATGLGEQELGTGAYANPQAAANLQQTQLANKYYGPNIEAQIGQIQSQTGVNRQQAINLLQLQQLMPNEFALEMLKLQAQHPFKGIITAGGPNAIAALAHGAMNIPVVDQNGAISFFENTYPGSNSLNQNNNIFNKKNSLNSQAAQNPSSQNQNTPQPQPSNFVPPPQNLNASQNAITALKNSGLNSTQLKAVYSGERQLAPDGYIYFIQNGKLARSKRE